MTAAISSNVEQLGVPLGALALSAVAQEWAFTMVNRVNGLVELIADDASFLYSNTAAFTLAQRVPAGGSVKLPVYQTQSWYFKQDTSATTLRAATVE